MASKCMSCTEPRSTGLLLQKPCQMKYPVERFIDKDIVVISPLHVHVAFALCWRYCLQIENGAELAVAASFSGLE